ncbi:ABC transporter ATP-binding protein [Garciella nitratireducens]|uniref:ABC transporter ATP-binding protein n=1 Tax=Garciella nitratireducens TaxID=218205 RepID=UPI001BD5BDDB|nr:ABC transporter ATP-binding protein [Garciella nitratireducens]
MANVKLKNLCKVYRGNKENIMAVNNINLEIKDKEFIVLVGPSGCGKSTTLRMIAGLEKISSGELYIDNTLMNDISVKDRDIAMVFQNYALYPHMTIAQNMGFPLKMRKVSKGEINKRVNEVAQILRLTDYLNRKPEALSGGQRQRVALGRAMVRNPKVFLLDEPLSNLDAKLRVSMRSEIVKLHRKLQTTFIYVTHDQTEAMTMGDKIAVLKDGNLEQFDTPNVLFHFPINKFVAEFIGSPQMNVFESKLEKIDDGLGIKLNKRMLKLGPGIESRIDKKYIGEDIYFGIRPDRFSIGNAKSPNSILVSVDATEFMGSDTYVYFHSPQKQDAVIARIDPDNQVHSGDKIYLQLDMEAVHLFDRRTEKTILSTKQKQDMFTQGQRAVG